MAFTPARVLVLAAFLAAMLAIAFADHEEVDTYSAKLLGANEVPKNDSQAARNAVGDQRGVVYMKLRIYKEDGKAKWVKYTVKASRLKGEMPPIKTHVHPGRKGENNPVLLDLPCTYEKKGAEEWRCEGALGRTKRIAPTRCCRRSRPSPRTPARTMGISTRRGTLMAPCADSSLRSRKGS
ncbi:hypothetical protein CLOM_g20788 [Closterium sp. NIES-68]|nr:hypothetical protein CLOM_g20788 [Closterium sp. NIES-68]